MVIDMIHYKNSEIIIIARCKIFVLFNLGDTHIQNITEEIADAA